jgi:hypothetical protein
MATDLEVQSSNIEPEHRVIECIHCTAKQRIHIGASQRATQMAAECVRCIKCGQQFVVILFEHIVSGPFAA